MGNNNINTKSGFVALIGKPNVGKSTLLNALVGQKISITADKPQTTRYKILGIVTENNTQVIYVDTPGIHQNKNKEQLNTALNTTAMNVLHDVDLILWLVSGTHWTTDDDLVLTALKDINTPVILLINKVDKIKDKAMLLPYIAKLQQKHNFAAIMPISALTDKQFNSLTTEVAKYLTNGPFYYDEQATNQTLKFQLAEILREKLTRMLQEELPYSISVLIEKIEHVAKIKNNEQITLTKVQAVIWVERESQKAIVIGKQGATLKKAATNARLDMEKLLQQKVFLSTMVKCKDNWSQNTRDLLNLGLIE